MDFEDAEKYMLRNAAEIAQKAINGNEAAKTLITIYGLAASAVNGTTMKLLIGAVEAYQKRAEHPMYRRE